VRSLPNIVLVHGAFADGSDPGETIDVRYSAFTSLQRAGPTATCVRGTSPVVGGRDTRPLRPKSPVALAPRIKAPSLDPEIANKASPSKHGAIEMPQQRR